MPILDIVICAIAVLVFFTGYVRGFFKSLLKFLFALLSLVAAIAVARMLLAPEMAEMGITFIADLKNSLVASFTDAFAGTPGFTTLATSAEVVDEALALSKIPALGLGEIIIGWVPEGSAAMTIAEIFGEQLGGLVMTIALVIVLYIVFRIITSLFAKLVKLTLKDPVIRLIDRILGGVFGVAVWGLIVFVILALVSYLGTMVPDLSTVTTMISENPVTSQLNKINPLLPLLQELIAPAA